MTRFIQFGAKTPDSTCIRVNTTHDVIITVTPEHLIINVHELAPSQSSDLQQTLIVHSHEAGTGNSDEN